MLIDETETPAQGRFLPSGVMSNAYPFSVGKTLADTLELPGRHAMSKLGRRFPVIDYDINRGLVSPDNLDEPGRAGMTSKPDLVPDHLPVRSPRFQDLQVNGDDSPCRGLLIDWRVFWQDDGTVDDSQVITDKGYLARPFMGKPRLPVSGLQFPGATARFDADLARHAFSMYQDLGKGGQLLLQIAGKSTPGADHAFLARS